MTNRIDFDFNIPTAFKGWVGLAPQGRGALHNMTLTLILNLILIFRKKAKKLFGVLTFFGEYVILWVEGVLEVVDFVDGVVYSPAFISVCNPTGRLD